jgi:hypothetical protein
MKLLALVQDPKQISRFLTHICEPTDTPRRAANRGPPFWKSTVLFEAADACGRTSGLPVLFRLRATRTGVFIDATV